ncbi:NADH-quinone oxidoreductase subunit NuoE [Georgenia sp. EYE_87]|uniref:NADH-quinone oxidoreductase subunit NuoE n=1 Tax=Georgenia sp. EYE_87 TaxID=2853448 RepID=UPI002004588C|nr:NADH-quinone oxidoreductase subunit NuoE [Georgenia sp. EYE_87]MCK6209812.1 NADH-quinone oxidoreductase subunit NuoE [Georgenia sp. EYE_87]
MSSETFAPEADARLRAEAAEIISRYPEPRSALLPMLHLVQSEDGFVSPRGIALCADILGLTRAEVSAVATFYTRYKRHPNGDYTVGVCTNALCAVMGGDIIFERVSEHLGIGHDETTADGKITLEQVECNAACDYAPVVMVNWEFFDNQTPTSAIELVDQITAGDPVRPTRGADTVATFKEISHVLAGFEDGRANEGVGAGEATLLGLRIARENDWRAPQVRDDSRGDGRAQGQAGGPATTTPGVDLGGATVSGTVPVGEVQSSAERKPTTEADVSAETVDKDVKKEAQ